MPEPNDSPASIEIEPIEIVVEREHVIAFEESFRRIMAYRADGIRVAMDSVPLVNRRNAYRVLRVVAPLGWLLTMFLIAWTIHTAGLGSERLFGYVGAAAFFGVIAVPVLLVDHDRADAWADRGPARLRAWTARRSVKRMLPIAPFRVTYSVTAGTWTSYVHDPLAQRRFRPADVALALCDGPLACLYRRKRSLAQFAIVWLVDPAVRDALDALMPGRVQDVPSIGVDPEPPPRRSA